MSPRVIVGDCLDVLPTLDAESVQCVVTSPPYFGLRDYGCAGQIGLEATPDAYVAKLVAVFREVWRVLRDDGTLWLNLGDSYNNRNATRQSSHQTGLGFDSADLQKSWVELKAEGRTRMAFTTGGLKEKDLLGIPWRVAFALQQPFYAGHITREIDRVWLAAMIDTEGSIGINWQRAGEHRANDSYSLSIKVSNTSRRIVDRCGEIAGRGSVLLHDQRGRDCFAWSVYGDDARSVLREVYPYLVAKQQEARLGYGALSHATYEAIRLLHAGSETTVDSAAPPSCLIPGWYLRSDIIWHKPNPMPESVTDRPTKAHEYLFLLSKSERYVYDADAIAEPYAREYEDGPAYGGLSNKTGTKRILGTMGTGQPLTSTVDAKINPAGVRNRRTVWTVATQPYSGAHFATFPPALIEPCILAGSKRGDTVLDPFGGAGTTGLVADRLGRNGLLIELNPEYAKLATNRMTDDCPMFVEVVSGSLAALDASGPAEGR